MELLAAECTDRNTIRFTIAHPGGLQSLEGSVDEVADLAAAVRELAVLAAAAGEDEHGWIHALPVGDKRVRMGLRAGGEIRILVTPR